MPQVTAWEEFFDPGSILEQLGLDSSCNDVVEFGCGYGTFTLPAAQRVNGTVYAIDIDATMLETARRRAEQIGSDNIEFIRRDFINDGTGLASGSVDFAMVFNILHHDEPIDLLREAHRNLKSGGRLGIIHWNFDPDTPRGPPMNVRPRPEQCKAWAETAGFVSHGDALALPPHHYGMVLIAT